MLASLRVQRTSDDRGPGPQQMECGVLKIQTVDQKIPRYIAHRLSAECISPLKFSRAPSVWRLQSELFVCDSTLLSPLLYAIMPKPKTSKRSGATAEHITGPRFANFESDPRYQLPSKKNLKTKLDKRF